MINFEHNSSNLNDKVLQCLEQFWEIKLPKEYRKFLLTQNGGYPDKSIFFFKNQNIGSDVQGMLGITPEGGLNLLTEIRTYTGRIPSSTFPIGYDSFGNLILISVKNPDRGKIYFWDHELEADPDQGEVADYSNLTLIADSFDEFINNLKSDEEESI